MCAHMCVCVCARAWTCVFILKLYGEDGSGTEALRVHEEDKGCCFFKKVNSVRDLGFGYHLKTILSLLRSM